VNTTSSFFEGLEGGIVKKALRTNTNLSAAVYLAFLLLMVTCTTVPIGSLGFGGAASSFLRGWASKNSSRVLLRDSAYPAILTFGFEFELQVQLSFNAKFKPPSIIGIYAYLSPG
jgi:hypothetical protein